MEKHDFFPLFKTCVYLCSSMTYCSNCGSSGQFPDAVLSGMNQVIQKKNTLSQLGAAQDTVNLVLLGAEQNWGLKLGIKYFAQGYMQKKLLMERKTLLRNQIFPASLGFISCMQNVQKIGIKVFTSRMRDNGLPSSPRGELFEYQYGIPSVRNIPFQPQ